MGYAFLIVFAVLFLLIIIFRHRIRGFVEAAASFISKKQQRRLEALQAAQREQAMETKEWDITMTRHGKLGIKFDFLGFHPNWMVTEVIPDGAMSQFNAIKPDLAVCEGDLVTKINGEAPSRDGVSRIADGCTMTL